MRKFLEGIRAQSIAQANAIILAVKKREPHDELWRNG